MVVFFNRGDHPLEIKASLTKDLKVDYDNYSTRDAIEHKDLGLSTEDTIKVTVNKHSVKVYVLKLYKHNSRSTKDD